MQSNFVALHGILTLFFILSGCASIPTPTATPQSVSIYASPAARPWLGFFYACAEDAGALLHESAPEDAQITLRVGEPPTLEQPAYRVGVEELWLVVHPQNQVAPLSQGQVLGLFGGHLENWSDLGGAGSQAQVWAFAPENDLMAVFDGTTLRGLPIASTARLAVGAEQMRREIAGDVNAIGLMGISAMLDTGAQADVRFLQKIAAVPVLAIPKGTADDLVNHLLACAQQP